MKAADTNVLEYAKAGLPSSTISELTGAKRQKIYHYRKRLGLIKARPRIKKEVKDKVIALIKENKYAQTTIGLMCGVEAVYVSQLARKLGVVAKNAWMGRRRPRVARFDDFEEDFQYKTPTAKEMLDF